MNIGFFLGIILYTIFFIVAGARNFKWAVATFIVTLPFYWIRFAFGPLPTTLLEWSFGLLFFIWLIRYARQDLPVIRQTIQQHRFFFVLLGVFFISSIAGVLVSDMVILSLGQWRAYFLEPILLFFVLLGRRKEISSKEIIWFLLVATLSVSIYAIVQKFTGWGISTPEWTKLETRRVTAFFLSPNAVGLFLGPIIILMIYMLVEKVSWWKKIFQHSFQQKKSLVVSVILFLSLLAVLFTKSEGTMIALGAGVATILFLMGWKKTVVGLVLIGIVGCGVVSPIRSAVLFQDKAGQNRLTLWRYSWNFFTESPKNFLFGAGVRQFFRKIQKPHYDVKKMERLIYPHNIIFNFWSEIGLFGVLSFMGMLGYLFRETFYKLKKNKLWGATLVAMLVAIVVHGLVDVPYFKNDLAMLFWILAYLFFASQIEKETAT